MVARLRGRPTPRPPGSEKEDDGSVQQTAAPKTGGSSKLLIMITSLSLLSAVGTTSALLYFTLGPGHKPAEVLHGEAAQKSTGPIMDMGPFIVNLGDVNNRRYLRVAISLDFQTSDPHFVGDGNSKGGGGHGGGTSAVEYAELQKSLKKLEPIFQDVTITTLSAKSPEDLGTPTGKEMLKAELIAKINRHMPTNTAVQNIYFTNFVIQ